MLRLVPPSPGDPDLTTSRRLGRRRTGWVAVWWSVVVLAGTSLSPVAAVIVAGSWPARAALVVVLPIGGLAAIFALVAVQARIGVVDTALALHRQEQDSDRVLGGLRARASARPARLHVQCAQDSPGGVVRDVALVKDYMSTRPYDLEDEVYEPSMPNVGAYAARLSYRLREAS